MNSKITHRTFLAATALAVPAWIPRVQAEPHTAPATWRKLPAFLLTDGHSEAVVVPSPVPGSREIAALWVIAQTIPTDAVFMRNHSL